MDGQSVSTGVAFSIVVDGQRPDIFAPATVLDGKIGVMVQDLVPGNWRVFAKVTANPETPVIDCGYFTVT